MTTKNITDGLKASAAFASQTLKPHITWKKEQDQRLGFKNEHSLIEEKVVPVTFDMLVRELSLPHHKKLSDEVKLGSNFEECIGTLAARLDIALDGDYEASALFDVLLQAMRRRVPGAIQNHHLHDPRLVNAKLTEKKETLTLEELGAKEGINLKEAANGEGPYTICRACVTSFDCCANRTCELSSPAQQLGDTMKILKETLQ